MTRVNGAIVEAAVPGCIVELMDGKFFQTQSIYDGGHAVFVPGDGWVPYKRVVAWPETEGSGSKINGDDFLIPSIP